MNTNIENNLIGEFIRENVASKYKEKTDSFFIQYYSLLQQIGNFEDIGKLDSIFKEIIEQSLTDYHNNIVEKIKNKDGEYIVENRDGTKVEFLEKKLLLSLLQDTNK